MNSQVILVTGANGGLGRAIARAFLLQSPQNVLWLGIHSNRSTADELAAEFHNRARCVAIDVTRADSWKPAIDTILAESHRIDVLVNNAGKHQDALLATMPAETWDSVRATNLDATFLGCQAVLPAMIAQRGGRIVNIASLSALLAPPGQTNYAAAKAGIVALTQSLAKEVARLNITVNAVCPGFIESNSTTTMSEDDRKAALSKVPMRRFGKPEEVAAAVTFLASPEASYITGATIKIDGGIL